MGVSKVVYGSETLVDLTGDTVSAESLLAGYTAHDASGEPVEGTVLMNEYTKVLDSSLFQNGVYWYGSGEYSASTANYVCLKDHLKVTPLYEVKVTLEFNAGSDCGFLWYDENKNFIKGQVAGAISGKQFSAKAPSTAAYFKININYSGVSVSTLGEVKIEVCNAPAVIATGQFTRTSTANSPTSITLGIDFTPDVVLVIAVPDDLARSNYKRFNIGYTAVKMAKTSSGTFEFYATVKYNTTDYYVYGSNTKSGVSILSNFSYNDTTKTITLAEIGSSSSYSTNKFVSGYYWAAWKN